MRSMSRRLAPLSEEPIDEEQQLEDSSTSSCSSAKKGHKYFIWKHWIKTHVSVLFNNKHKSNLRILLSVLGCPLFPLPVYPHLHLPLREVCSSAQYIVQQFMATTGCRKLEDGKVNNIYATGKVRMLMVEDDHHRDSSSSGNTIGTRDATANNEKGAGGVWENGCFVIWQMVPTKWLIELVVRGHKVVAGSDGKVAWRHTPWHPSHPPKGGVRPLRRILQGLDPVAISAVFSSAQFVGEKQISSTDCFVLKLSANKTDLTSRGDNSAEMIKHVIYGYFSQRSGLLIYLEDSYLTRIQSPGTYPLYWETTMRSMIEDYQTVDGVMIAHSGRSIVTITRFGDNLKTGPLITRLEETWTVDDIAFNVPGLSMDCFLPPEGLHKDCLLDENPGWRSPPPDTH